MHVREFFLIIAAVILSINTVFANSENSVKIALIAEKNSDFDKSPLISILEVELSQKKDIQLLERAAIDKILEEQKLSAAGLLDRNMTIKIGKILRADAFIILSLENPVPERSRVNQVQDANDLIRVRVSETAHGLRLLDSFEQSNSKNPQEAVKGIIQKIESVLHKISQPDEKLILVGIVDIHRVQLGEQYKMLERTLPTMLSIRLSLEPQIIMLEREDLKVLLDEKLMTEGEDTEFWSSAILIDGYIQPHNGQLDLHLNLKQAAGDNLDSIVIPVEPNESVAAIDKASTEIIKKLQNSPPTAKWNPEQEAKEFYRQGMFLFNYQHFEDAITLLETAYALQPKNIYYTIALFKNEWSLRGHAGIVYHSLLTKEVEPCYTDLELAEVVSRLVRQIRDGCEKKTISQNIFPFDLLESLGGGTFPPGYLGLPDSVATEQIKTINQSNRKILFETLSKFIKEERPDRNITVGRLVWISSDDPYELMGNVKKIFTEFVMPPEMGGRINSVELRNRFCGQLFSASSEYIRSPSETHLKNTGNQLPELWKQYLKELAEVNDLSVKFNSICRIMIEYPRSTTNGHEEEIYYGKICLEIIQNDFGQFDDSIKLLLKGFLADAMSMAGMNLNERASYLEKLYRHLIETNDIDGLLKVGWPHISPVDKDLTPEVAERCCKLLQQIYSFLDTCEGDKQINTALADVRDFQSLFKKRFPQISQNKDKQISLSAKLLLSKNDWINQRIFYKDNLQTKIHQNMLWLAFREEQGRSVSLAGIDLKNKTLKALWQTELSGYGLPELTGLSIGKNNSYLSLSGIGILEFPGNLKEGRGFIENPKVLTQSDGLPSNNITSISEQINNKIWIAYGESRQECGLGLYDTKTRQWETIFCSTLNKEQPFNGGYPYKIKQLISTQSGIIFFELSTFNNSRKQGLWCIDSHNRNYKYIGPIQFIQDIQETTDNKLLIYSNSSLTEYDIESEHFNLMYGDYEHIKSLFSAYSIPLNKISNNPVITGEYSFHPDVLDLSKSAIYKNKFWARLGRSQIIIVRKDKSIEEAEIIKNNILNGEPVWKFVSTPYGLVAIGDGIVGLIETGD